jgi:hypothetical protein
MAALTVQNVANTGLSPTYSSVGVSGDTFANDGRTIFRAVNAATAARTVTVDSPTSCNQGSAHDIAIVVAASDDQVAGPFDPARFGTTVTLTYSATASLTIAALRI